MSGVHTNVSLEQATRQRDISSWKDGKLSNLSQKDRKRYLKRKTALIDYFTTNDSLEDITLRHHLSSELLEKLARQCLMLHRDGEVWGFRALQPRVTVVDHTPDTPRPTGDDDEAEGDTLVLEEPELPSHNGHASAEELFADLDSQPAEQEEPAAPLDEPDEVIDTAKREALRLADQSSLDNQDVPLDVGSDNEVSEDAMNRVPTDVGDEIAVVETIPDGMGGSEDTAVEMISDGTEAGDVEQEEVTLVEQETGSADDEEETIDLPRAQEMDASVVGEEQAQEEGTEEAAGEEAISQLQLETPPETPVELEDDAAEEVGAAPEAVDEHSTSSDDTAEEAAFSGELIPTPDEMALVEMGERAPVLEDSAAEDVSIASIAYESPGAISSLALPPVTVGRARSRIVSTKRVLQMQRSVRRRWLRNVEQTRRKQTRRMISGVVLVAMLVTLLIPLGIGIGAYSAYSSIRGIALDGVDHLLNVKALLPVSKSDPTAALNPDKLQQARVEFDKARVDFLQLQGLVNRPEVQDAVSQFAPQYIRYLGMAQHLVQVGIDVSQMGNELIGVAMLGANIMHSSPLASGSTKPLITVSDVNDIEGTLVHALYYISDIRLQMSQVSLKDLPISNTQKKQLDSVMTLLPQAESMIQQAQGLVGAVSWLLGVGGTRRFLVQTMDRAELRPGGGFTGQYGVLEIQNGRMAPFNLQDVTELDYNSNGSELGRQAPPGYRNWMNFGNWGVRDSNISGDFPTNAQFAMQLFQEEGGGPIDGDIAFTPTVIEHILAVPGVGSIYVKEYNETITAQNLEDKLHYYQQDPNAIRLQQQLTGTHNAATRKAFTSLLGKLLLDKVRHLPVKTLVKVAQNATKDIQSHDLEIYFNNPQAEAWLVQHGYSDSMSTFSKTDGFMVVQANISISKASQYVHTDYQDNVTLDAQGGATHNLTITLNYQKLGEVWGQNTYADYIRVYAPSNAQLLGGSGFDSGHALCTPPKPPGGTGGTGTGGTGATGTPPSSGCGQYAHYFPDSGRYCPTGNYNLSGPNSFVPGKGFGPWPVDSLSGPTSLASDTPGRAMWGGLTVTPMNCISTITLSWYVPNAVKHVPGQPVYQMLVEKQGGYIPSIEITIDASALKGVKSYSFNGNLYADRVFALANNPARKNGK